MFSGGLVWQVTKVQIGGEFLIAKTFFLLVCGVGLAGSGLNLVSVRVWGLGAVIKCVIKLKRIDIIESYHAFVAKKKAV